MRSAALLFGMLSSISDWCVGCSPSEESVRKSVRESLSIRPWMASYDRPVTCSTLRPTTRVASVSDDDSTPHFYQPPFTHPSPTIHLRFTFQCLPVRVRVPTSFQVRSPSPTSKSEVQVRSASVLKIQEFNFSSKIRESLVRCGRVHD